MKLLKRPKYVDRKYYYDKYHKKSLFSKMPGQDIIYSPTPMQVVDHALDYIQFARHNKTNVVEVGCGDGRWLIEAARRCPRLRCVGYEMHAERARLARSLASKYKVANRVKILTLDYKKRVAPEADYLILYMYPDVNEAVVKWFAKTNKSFNVMSVSYKLWRDWSMSSQASKIPKNLICQEIDVISMSAWAGLDVYRYHVKRTGGKR